MWPFTKRKPAANPMTIEGLLLWSPKYGDMIRLDGGGFWTVAFKGKANCPTNTRVRATGRRVGFNDMVVTQIQKI